VGSFSSSAVSPQVSTLRFVLAVFALNGTFLGYEDLADQWQLCQQVN
jgi:hypothetical protein